MAAAHCEQLEDKLARYERIMSQCPRCKASLDSEEIEREPPPLAPPSSVGSSRQSAPKASSTASALPTKSSMPNTRQNQSIRSSKENTSTSRPLTLPSRSDAAGPISSKSAFASRSQKPTTGTSQCTGHPSSRSSKKTTVKTVPPVPDSSSTQRPSTAHSLNIRPTSLRPSTSSTGTQPADSNQLNATRPRLSRSGSNAGNDVHKQTVWGVSADKMLGDVPLGWVWDTRLWGLDKSMLAAVAIDTSAVLDDTIEAVDDGNDDHLLRLVRNFAHRHSDKRVNFQQFLLVCLCVVLSAQKTPRSSIVETLKICISDSSERNVERYLRGVRWANELMDRLFFAGWRYRAVDLLVIWNRTVATYGTMASSSSQKTNDYFFSHLTRAEYCKDVEERPNRIHTTIPWIVKKEFGDEISYERICKALGYSNEYIRETKHLHSNTRPRADLNIRSSDYGGSPSESQAFHSARQSADRDSNHPQLDTMGVSPANDLDGAAYSRTRPLLGRQTLPKDDNEDSSHRNPTDQTADIQRSKRIIPDRSAQSLRDMDNMRRRRELDQDSSGGEFGIYTSRGEGAPQSTKRPLPDSPTSQSQSEITARRRLHEREKPSRGEDMGSPPRSGRDLHRRRDRA